MKELAYIRFYADWIKEACNTLGLSANTVNRPAQHQVWSRDRFSIRWSIDSFPRFYVTLENIHGTPIAIRHTIAERSLPVQAKEYSESLLKWAHSDPSISLDIVTPIVTLFGNNRFVPPE